MHPADLRHTRSGRPFQLISLSRLIKVQHPGHTAESRHATTASYVAQPTALAQTFHMTFDDFVQHIFNQEVGEISWYHRLVDDAVALPNDKLIALACEVFQRIEEVHGSFSQGQVSAGLRYLIDPFGGMGDAYLDGRVPEADRVKAVRLMAFVFERLFAVVCTNSTPVSSATLPREPYANLCYMWWDIFPRHGVPRRDDMAALDAAILQTMVGILSLDNVACQESALHGLGHWYSAKPELVEGAIARFIPHVSPILLPFAEAASSGNIM